MGKWKQSKTIELTTVLTHFQRIKEETGLNAEKIGPTMLQNLQ